MSAIHVSAQELSEIFTSSCYTIFSCTFLVYDWLLCLDQEVMFIWNWRSRRVAVASLVYALSRYAWLIQGVLTVVAIYPMSDLSCRANVWTQATSGTIGLIAISAFSALRAYALSNRSRWLVTIIILLALPSVVIHTVEQSYKHIENLPSPLNCSASSSLSQTFAISASATARVSSFLVELLVVSITWWYTYQSYRIHRGINLGKTISSLLFYNGSMYFLFLASLYILDLGFGISHVQLAGAQQVLMALERCIDPITSILTCRFILSLRRFDSTIESTTYSGMDPQLRDPMASTVLRFGAQPSASLPAVIASFAHPVHVDVAPSETYLTEDQSEWREMDTMTAI